ncbi:MAG TPA: VOC family protein [Xanthobacteraceae bacterium]|nr:VOC family protein [Xanthobacteraceae bacterium]
MKMEPYLHFNGRAEEVLGFYEKALGAKVETKMRFSESPDPHPDGRLPAGFENKIMHASLLIGDARVMLSDGGALTGQSLGGFSLSLQCDSETDARHAFDALTDGGRIVMPIGPTFWSPCFGMATDRFGVHWMVTVDPAHSA